jgi:ATP-dependent Clp protease ATP-binding subunit ClpC
VAIRLIRTFRRLKNSFHRAGNQMPDFEKLRGLEAHLNANILGQAEVIAEIVPLLIDGQLGLASSGRPLANFLMLGSPGTGKTETCNVSADWLLGIDKLVRFDLSEYQTQESVYRLIGHNGERGLLGQSYDRVGGEGFFLFDEIEKANERVLDLFLQLLSAARITLGTGETLDVSKFYMAATSNIGSSLLVASKTNVRETLARRATQEAQALMRPEIYDRFDKVLVFNRLSYAVQVAVARLHLSKELQEQASRGHVVTADEEAVQAIVRAGYSDKQGARQMRNAARNAVKQGIRDALMESRTSSGALKWDDSRKIFFIT